MHTSFHFTTIHGSIIKNRGIFSSNISIPIVKRKSNYYNYIFAYTVDMDIRILDNRANSCVIKK